LTVDAEVNQFERYPDDFLLILFNFVPPPKCQHEGISTERKRDPKEKNCKIKQKMGTEKRQKVCCCRCLKRIKPNSCGGVAHPAYFWMPTICGQYLVSVLFKNIIIIIF